MSIFQEDIKLICKITKKPVDEYTSSRLKVGDTIILSPKEYKENIITLYFGQGDGAEFNKDELEVVSISKRVLISDKEQIQKELENIYGTTS